MGAGCDCSEPAAQARYYQNRKRTLSNSSTRAATTERSSAGLATNGSRCIQHRRPASDANEKPGDASGAPAMFRLICPGEKAPQPSSLGDFYCRGRRSGGRHRPQQTGGIILTSAAGAHDAAHTFPRRRRLCREPVATRDVSPNYASAPIAAVRTSTRRRTGRARLLPPPQSPSCRGRFWQSNRNRDRSRATAAPWP